MPPRAPKRPPPARLRRDRHWAHGEALAAADGGPTPLERLLQALRLGLALLTDLLRPSDSPSDVPLTLLGFHAATARELSAGLDGGVREARAQEVVAFDASEGPKPLPTADGAAAGAGAAPPAPAAALLLRVVPAARVKAKRLGSEVAYRARAVSFLRARARAQSADRPPSRSCVIRSSL
jgi:hypothetical protein